mmetsp:Transcript_50734/g.100413  ORF Transcript_50734/g.100413 Transcript_50734/m.100413 type:complete len:208 (+) Transcript_50734:201-824(+)
MGNQAPVYISLLCQFSKEIRWVSTPALQRMSRCYSTHQFQTKPHPCRRKILATPTKRRARARLIHSHRCLFASPPRRRSLQIRSRPPLFFFPSRAARRGSTRRRPPAAARPNKTPRRRSPRPRRRVTAAATVEARPPLRSRLCRASPRPRTCRRWGTQTRLACSPRRKACSRPPRSSPRGSSSLTRRRLGTSPRTRPSGCSSHSRRP